MIVSNVVPCLLEFDRTNIHISFTASIQIIKAVEDYLVLTFCQTTGGIKHFSIILTRRPHSLPQDVSYSNLFLCFYPVPRLQF